MAPAKLTMEEMETKISQLDAAVETKSKEFTTFKADQETKEKALKADLDKAKSDKEALEAAHKSVLTKIYQAMDEDDPEKRKEAMKKAMKGEQEPEDKKDDEEKKAMKAELVYLRKQANLPKIQFLSAAYTGRVDDETLKSFKANWENSKPEQLDAEIERVKLFVDTTIMQGSQSTPEPIMGSTMGMPIPFSAGTKDEFVANLEKMPVDKLFDLGGPQ